MTPTPISPSVTECSGENARRSAYGRPAWTADLNACLRPDRVICVARTLHPLRVLAVLESGML